MNKSAISASPWLFSALAAMWLQGAVASSLPTGYAQGLQLLTAANVPVLWAQACVLGGIAADTSMAAFSLAALARPAWRKPYWQASLGLVAAYTLLGTALAPQLWADPFGALAKNMPLLILFYLQVKEA